MINREFNIDRMRVASPCHVGWDSMVGDGRSRFCGSCQNHVYNIVGLSRGEIESLVQTTEGRLCVRMYQRADETILTRDCSVGLQAVRKRIATFAGAVLSALLGMVSVGYGQKPEDCSYSKTKMVERVKIDSHNGQISGMIIDMNGAVVPGVEVKLEHEKQLVAKVRSDAEGLFTIGDIKPAEKYNLRINGQQGWKKQIVKGISITAGEKMSYALCLQPDNDYFVVVGMYREPL